MSENEEDIISDIINELLDLVTAEESDEKIDSEPEPTLRRHKRSTFSQTSIEGLCRICYDNLRYPIIYPCRCKGTMGAVHQPCLERWLEESNRSSCEVCGFVFSIERTPKYSALRSIFIYLKKSPRDLDLPIRPPKIDLIRCTTLTLLILAAIYIFIVAGDFYSSNNFNNFSPAKWTNYSLIFLIYLIIFSYFVWTFWTMDYQKNVWWWWWQKTSTVRMNYHHHHHRPRLVDEMKNLYVNCSHASETV